MSHGWHLGSSSLRTSVCGAVISVQAPWHVLKRLVSRVPIMHSTPPHLHVRRRPGWSNQGNMSQRRSPLGLGDTGWDDGMLLPSDNRFLGCSETNPGGRKPDPRAGPRAGIPCCCAHPARQPPSRPARTLLGACTSLRSRRTTAHSSHPADDALGSPRTTRSSKGGAGEDFLEGFVGSSDETCHDRGSWSGSAQPPVHPSQVVSAL